MKGVLSDNHIRDLLDGVPANQLEEGYEWLWQQLASVMFSLNLLAFSYTGFFAQPLKMVQSRSSLRRQGGEFSLALPLRSPCLS
jgi:hypothetical protein